MVSIPRLTVICAWTLLIGAWAIGNPPFAAPDERDHYVRALGVMSGDILGEPAPEAAGGKTPRQLAWTRQATRSVRVKKELVPPENCYVLDPTASAECLLGATAIEASRLTTPVGTYQPLPYLLAAPATEAATSAQGAVRAARVPGALLSLFLLVLAAFAMRSTTSLLGLLAAITPMVLFCASSVSGSGPEIAGGVAVSATAVGIAQERSPPRWLWAALAISGAILVLSRSPGPVWVVLLLLLPVALIGPRETWTRVREGGATAWASLGVIVIAIAVNRLWETLYGPAISPVTDSPGYGLQLAIGQWWRAMPDLVGKFGYLEFALPVWVALAWLLVLMVLGTLAWRASTRRGRVVIIGTLLIVLGLPLLVFMAVTRQTGFGLQGRHVLPVLVALPILIGALLPAKGRAVAIAAWVAAPALAVLQLAAFWFNARRSSVGVDGPFWFLPTSTWAPPGGWAVALVPAILGALAIVAAGLMVGRDADPALPSGTSVDD